LCSDGWYLVASKEKSQTHHGQLRTEPVDSLGECSWSGQSGSEKRDEKAPELLVRDIGVANTAANDAYNKRAKLYTYDPVVGDDDTRKSECVHRGLKLLCVHDKRKYNKRPTGASGSAPVAAKNVSAATKSAPVAAKSAAPAASKSAAAASKSATAAASKGTKAASKSAAVAANCTAASRAKNAGVAAKKKKQQQKKKTTTNKSAPRAKRAKESVVGVFL
jgi:hypothetical protein